MVLLDRQQIAFYESDFVRTDNFLEIVTTILLNTTVNTVRFQDVSNPKWSSKQLRLLFATIARLPCLRLLSIAQTKLSLSLLTVVLEKATPLLELDVWGSTLIGTDQDVSDFAAALKTHPELEAVYFKRVKFSQKIFTLDPFMKACRESKLHVLKLEQVEWSPDAVSAESLVSLVGSAPSCFSEPKLTSRGLTQLSLEKLNLQETHMVAIAEGVQRSSTLRELHLSQMHISERAVGSLARALQKNESVKRLVVHNCQLSDQAAAELAKMLRVNTTITSIELSENRIGDDGAVNLADALFMSSSVKRLVLHGNLNIKDRGIQALLKLAEQNYVLEALELFSFSKNRSTNEQLDVQKKINSNMHSADIGRTRRNSAKRPRVWYE